MSDQDSTQGQHEPMSIDVDADQLTRVFAEGMREGAILTLRAVHDDDAEGPPDYDDLSQQAVSLVSAFVRLVGIDVVTQRAEDVMFRAVSETIERRLLNEGGEAS